MEAGERLPPDHNRVPKSPAERGHNMGATHVTVAIRNPAEPGRVWEGLFSVDTGATDCLVPKQHLESIGLVPEGQRIYGLAGRQRNQTGRHRWTNRVHGRIRLGNHRIRKRRRRAPAGRHRPRISRNRSGPAQSGSQEASGNPAPGLPAQGLEAGKTITGRGTHSGRERRLYK